MRALQRCRLGLWLLAVALPTAARGDSPSERELRDAYEGGVEYTDRIEFPPRVGAAGNAINGQRAFGLSADGSAIDPTLGLFTGVSAIAGPIEGNGRVCATCHRPDQNLGLPATPLSNSVPQSDALFTGLVADTGAEPLGLDNFDRLALLFHRPGRFNPLLDESDPLRQVFFWRKTTRLVNTVFMFGMLNDGRMRELVETTRQAVFTHTQDGDLRFDDLADPQRLRDIAAFMESQIDCGFYWSKMSMVQYADRDIRLERREVSATPPPNPHHPANNATPVTKIYYHGENFRDASAAVKSRRRWTSESVQWVCRTLRRVRTGVGSSERTFFSRCAWRAAGFS